jgi:hypothetical protein
LPTSERKLSFSPQKPGTRSIESEEGTMPNDHGPSVKNDKQYDGLRKKGMSKARAAKIANTPGASKKGGKKSS